MIGLRRGARCNNITYTYSSFHSKVCGYHTSFSNHFGHLLTRKAPKSHKLHMNGPLWKSVYALVFMVYNRASVKV